MSTQASNEKLLNQASRIAAGSAEFTVMHVSATLNHSSLNINSDDPLAEEDTIEGMLEADAVNLVEGKPEYLSASVSNFLSIPLVFPRFVILFEGFLCCVM